MWQLRLINFVMFVTNSIVSRERALARNNHFPIALVYACMLKKAQNQFVTRGVLECYKSHPQMHTCVHVPHMYSHHPQTLYACRSATSTITIKILSYHHYAHTHHHTPCTYVQTHTSQRTSTHYITTHTHIHT